MFHQFCTSRDITLRFSCPYTSSQNGKSERKIRSINNIIRTLLCHASLPPSFWPHALNTVTYLLNILPSKLLGNLNPTHFLYRKSSTYTHQRVFGCLCFPLFPSTTIHKLHPRFAPCIFLGYPSSHRGYKSHDLSSRKIIISRHVLFDKATFPLSQSPSPSSRNYQFLDDNIPLRLLKTTQTNPPQLGLLLRPAHQFTPTLPSTSNKLGLFPH